MLILHGLAPLHWALAGVGLGITLLLLWLGGQRLGLSTGFENLCALALHTAYFERSEVRGSRA